MPDSGVTGEIYAPPSFRQRVVDERLNQGALRDVDLSNLGSFKRLFWEQVNWRRIVKESGADVLYSSANYALIRCPIPQILLIQGEISFNPYYQKAVLPRLSRAERAGYWLRRRMVTFSMHNSDIVLFPSETAMNSVVRENPGLAEKSFVNYLAAEDALRDTNDARAWKEGGVLKTLYLSVYYPHKDPVTLVSAIGQIRDSGTDATATVTMNDDEFSHWSTGIDDLQKLREPGNSDFLNLGHVPHKDIRAILKTHDVLVSTSLAETFEFQLVEGMAVGLPVVATDIPIHREVCGDAALYFAPGDHRGLAKRLLQLDGDPALRAALAERGRARVGRKYSWRRHMQVLHDCVARLG
jgi:glycosyltransferase involved in cell wall biosynthesis